MCFLVLTYAGDAEHRGDPVGERHLDSVSRAQGAQPEENSRPLTGIDVTFND
jgi:hypothetical protein